MIIPVRCWTCGSLVGDKWEEFEERVENGEEPGEVLDDLKVKRWCCRRMLITHSDLVDEILPFS